MSRSRRYTLKLYCSANCQTTTHLSFLFLLQETLPSQSYDYIVDQQPIAAKLFRQFCAKHKNTTLRHYNDFLDAVDAYELELEESRVKTAQVVVTKYLTRPATSDSGVDTCEEPQGRTIQTFFAMQTEFGHKYIRAG